MENKILQTLHKGLLNLYGGNRTDKNIHVSQLHDFCPRRYALSRILNLSYYGEDNADFGMLLTRAIGCKYEDIAYETLIAGVTRIKNKIKRKVNIKYHIINDIWLTGEIDIVLGKYVMEIKSMRPEEWDSEEIPIKYQSQVKGYLSLINLLNKKDLSDDFGFIVCFRKLQKKVPVKVKKINYDKEMTKKIRWIIKEIKLWAKTMQLPDRVCNNLHNFTAKNCPFRMKCFE
jgi:hypothetical protein